MTNSAHQLGVMIRLTLREARRRRIAWIGLGLGLAFAGLFTLGFYFAYEEYQAALAEGFGPAGQAGVTVFASGFTTAGLYVTNFLVVILAVLLTVGAISSEIQTNTIHAIAVKPIRRWEIVLGKWIGYALMLTALTTLLVLGIVVPVWVISGFWVGSLPTVLFILILEALAVMSVSMAGSAMLPTMANGVVVFMLYGLAFVGGWVEQLGTLLGSQTARDIGIASSLLMPSEALWRYAAGQLQGDSLLTQIGGGPFGVASQPSEAFVVYGVLYTVAMVGLAVLAFSERDF
jgi:ABC-type transport system involved in multi-copper enzyme maturation permease subunit